MTAFSYFGPLVGLLDVRMWANMSLPACARSRTGTGKDANDVLIGGSRLLGSMLACTSQRGPHLGEEVTWGPNSAACAGLQLLRAKHVEYLPSTSTAERGKKLTACRGGSD
jgi:hypothetical protein